MQSGATIRDALHAQLCYQVFITPIHLPLSREYRDFANMACEFIEGKRSEVIHQESPRHHVLHRFTPKKRRHAKKILITHGWLSRAAYMVRMIRALYEAGYDVYALDFPAHGDAKGLQLPWDDAMTIIKNTLNEHGPFHGVIGHSFGGSMLLSTLNLAGQLPEFKIDNKPERVVLLASPTRIQSPIKTLAKRFKLSPQGCLRLRKLVREQAKIDLDRIRLNQFTAQKPDTPFLCIHGELDDTIAPLESIVFCDKYKNAQLALLPDVDHINILIDTRVENLVCEFLL